LEGSVGRWVDHDEVGGRMLDPVFGIWDGRESPSLPLEDDFGNAQIGEVKLGDFFVQELSEAALLWQAMIPPEPDSGIKQGLHRSLGEKQAHPSLCLP